MGFGNVAYLHRYTVKKRHYCRMVCAYAGFLAQSYPTASVLHTTQGLESNKCSSTPGAYGTCRELASQVNQYIS